MQKKNILILADYYLPHRGGIEVSVEQHTLQALKKGHTVAIITCHHDSSLSQEERIQTPYGTYTVYRMGKSRWSYLSSAKKFLKNYTKKNTIELIHCHTYTAALIGARAQKKLKIKTLVTIHEIFGSLRYKIKPRYTARIYKGIEKYIITREYNHIHVPSHYTATMLPKKSKNINIIGHDISISREEKNIDDDQKKKRQKKLGTEKYKILYYGHAGASKGTHTLVNALKKILPHHQEILFIANITASKNREKLIYDIEKKLPKNSYHIEDGMKLKKLQALVAAVDLIVVPSLSEGFGFVGAEVSKLNKKAIIARSGSLPEIVSGDIHFFEKENENQLQELILDLYNNNTTNDIPQTYSSSGNIERLINLYETI